MNQILKQKTLLRSANQYLQKRLTLDAFFYYSVKKYYKCLFSPPHFLNS